VFPGISGAELEYSKDAKWVTYVSCDLAGTVNALPHRSLVRAAADGSQRLQLTSPPLVTSSPHWSPDGKQIAFMGSTGGDQWRIYVVPFDGGALRQVTNGESGKYGDCDPSWSPDGTSLAFGSSIDGGAEESIHVVDLKTNHVSTLPGSEGMWSPRWSPDGRFIAALSGSRVDTLMLYEFRTRKKTQLFDQYSGYPSWSPDGETLFFRSSDQWIYRVRIRDQKAERITNLDDIPLADWGWFAVVPDNSLITARDASTHDIYALEWEAP
jgi:Tol biopolymer transport system component